MIENTLGIVVNGERSADIVVRVLVTGTDIVRQGIQKEDNQISGMSRMQRSRRYVRSMRVPYFVLDCGQPSL